MTRAVFDQVIIYGRCMPLTCTLSFVLNYLKLQVLVCVMRKKLAATLPSCIINSWVD